MFVYLRFFQAKDSSLLYGVCQTLVNLTNTFDKPEIPDEMKQLGEFAKVKLPKFAEKVTQSISSIKSHLFIYFILFPYNGKLKRSTTDEFQEFRNV